MKTLLSMALVVGLSAVSSFSYAKENPADSIAVIQKIPFAVRVSCKNGDVISDLLGKNEISPTLLDAFGTPSFIPLQGFTHRITEGERIFVMTDEGEYVEVGKLEKRLSWDAIPAYYQEKCKTSGDEPVYIETQYIIGNVFDSFALVTDVAKLKKKCTVGVNPLNPRGDRQFEYTVSYLSAQDQQLIASGKIQTTDDSACVTLKTLVASAATAAAAPFVILKLLIFGMPGGF